MGKAEKLGVNELLGQLTERCNAWASVVLIPDGEGRFLKCVASYNLPSDWLPVPNDLTANTMNARAHLNQQEIIEHDVNEDLPPGNKDVTRHRMTAVAVVPVKGVGTLEVIADSEGYRFDEQRLNLIRTAAQEIATQWC